MSDICARCGKPMEPESLEDMQAEADVLFPGWDTGAHGEIEIVCDECFQEAMKAAGLK